MANSDDPRWLTVLTTAAFQRTILLLSGLGLTIREALLNGPERPSLYVLFGGMMGLSAFIRNGNGKADK